MRKRCLGFAFIVAMSLVWMGCPRPAVRNDPPPPGPGPSTAPPPAPSVQKLAIRGYLAYRTGARGKVFHWRLRFYENSGLVLGSGRDRDGYAEFFGTYNPNTRRFYMIKHFKYRTRGRKRFYYKGIIRGGRLLGTAHVGGYWGQKYAGWAARVGFSRLGFTQGRPRVFVLRGSLRYRSGRSKAFLWRLSYYRSSGSCFGVVRDRDGRATFSGVYDRQTKRFFLRKRYSAKRVFYYIGRMTRSGVFGNARQYSFTSRRVYASWSARVLFRR